MLGMVLFFGLTRAYASKHPDDNLVSFLAAAAFALLPLSDGLFALFTGLYRDIVGRSYMDEYFYDAQKEHRWVPWTQTIVALTIIAAAGLGVFWARDAKM